MSEAVPHLEEGLARLAAIADDPRRTSRTARENAEQPREVPRPISREGGRSFPEDAGQKLSPSLSLVRDGPRAPRERATSDGATARPVGPQDRTDEHLDELLRPLCELAQRASLVGVTDRAGLRRALAPYEDGQVRYAVRQTVTMARAGLVKSPVGWLISKAHRADEEFFPPASSIRAIVPAPVAAEPEGTGPEADPEAEAVVSAWEATPGAHEHELDRIDQLIRRATPASVSRDMFRDPVWLHATRVLHWRAQHPAPPPPKEDST